MLKWDAEQNEDHIGPCTKEYREREALQIAIKSILKENGLLTF